jgi:hypothetical protein
MRRRILLRLRGGYLSQRFFLLRRQERARLRLATDVRRPPELRMHHPVVARRPELQLPGERRRHLCDVRRSTALAAGTARHGTACTARLGSALAECRPPSDRELSRRRCSTARAVTAPRRGDCARGWRLPKLGRQRCGLGWRWRRDWSGWASSASDMGPSSPERNAPRRRAILRRVQRGGYATRADATSTTCADVTTRADTPNCEACGRRRLTSAPSAARQP